MTLDLSIHKCRRQKPLCIYHQLQCPQGVLTCGYGYSNNGLIKAWSMNKEDFQQDDYNHHTNQLEYRNTFFAFVCRSVLLAEETPLAKDNCHSWTTEVRA